MCICGLFGVYLRFTQGCGRVPRNGGVSGWASVHFVLYTPSCRGGWFHTTELFLRGCFVVVVLRMLLGVVLYYGLEYHISFCRQFVVNLIFGLGLFIYVEAL